LLDRYESRGFVILAINIAPDESARVLPFLKNGAYRFVPLSPPAGWAKDVYGVEGAPTNMLLDPEGRVVFKPGALRSNQSVDALAEVIDDLLDSIGK
jgi:hypothetical protein